MKSLMGIFGLLSFFYIIGYDFLNAFSLWASVGFK